MKIFKHNKLKPSFSMIKDNKAKDKVGVGNKPPPPSFNNLIKFEPSWTKLVQFNTIWSNLNQFVQVWSNLFQFDQVWSIWSNLTKFDPDYSTLFQFDQVWSNLIQFGFTHIYFVFKMLLNLSLLALVFTSEHCDAVHSSVQHRSDCEPSCLGGTSGPFD